MTACMSLRDRISHTTANGEGSQSRLIHENVNITLTTINSSYVDHI
jgi:hypothetical protein